MRLLLISYDCNLDYRYLFRITRLLILSPRKAWQEICCQSAQVALSGFVFPMIGLVALCSFLSVLIRVGWSTAADYEYAMRTCCGLAVSLFAGFYLSAYLLETGAPRLGLGEWNQRRAQVLCGYGMAALFVLKMVACFFPGISLLTLVLSLYTAYILWEGLPLMHEKMGNDSPRMSLTLALTMVILLLPLLIERLFLLLTTYLD